VIHEHEATQLASAEMDFPLAPDEARELQHELAECPICAERAAAYHEQLRMVARLPRLDASDAVRRRVTAAALSGRTETRSPMMLVLAAALLGAMLLGIAAAAGAWLNNRQPDELSAAPTAPPRPGPSALAVASQDPSPSLGTEVGGTVFPDNLPPDSTAEVVSGNLRVRSEPGTQDTSERFEPLLQTGDRLFVIEGPVVVDDYDWYRVAPIGTDPGRPWTDLPAGWVSRGDHDATPWIEAVSPACPDSLEIASLNRMHPLERLACFGDTPLTIQAVVNGGSQSGWIADSRLGGYLDSPLPDMEIALAPGPGLSDSDLIDGRVATLAGAFDGASCGSTDADCRAQFMVSDVTFDPADFGERDVAITTTDNLRVRERPVVEDAGKLELLPNGTRLYVLGGPAVESGYAWYQVAVPDVRDAAGRPRVGWVAANDKAGDDWIGREEFDCVAPSAITTEQLAFLTSPSVFHGGLACYGGGGPYAGAALNVIGKARLECSDQDPPVAHWLMDGGTRIVLSDGDAAVPVVMETYPTALSCGAAAGPQTYRVRGHFDDAASSSCRQSGDRTIDELAAYECRSRFVATEFGVYPPAPTPTPTPPPAP
jgi:hypothetical protein